MDRATNVGKAPRLGRPPNRLMREMVTPELVRDLFDYDPTFENPLRYRRAGKKRRPGGRPPIQAGDPVGRPIDAAGHLQAALWVAGHDFRVLVHHLVWVHQNGAWPIGVIDHIDGNPANNRIENLRDVPQRVNAANRRDAGRYGTGIIRHGVRYGFFYRAGSGASRRVSSKRGYETAEAARAAREAVAQWHDLTGEIHRYPGKRGQAQPFEELRSYTAQLEERIAQLKAQAAD